MAPGRKILFGYSLPKTSEGEAVVWNLVVKHQELTLTVCQFLPQKNTPETWSLNLEFQGQHIEARGVTELVARRRLHKKLLALADMYKYLFDRGCLKIAYPVFSHKARIA